MLDCLVDPIYISRRKGDLPNRAGPTAGLSQDKRPTSGDTAITITPHGEEVVTPATMATLSSGEFVGITADDPEEEMPLKGFHARILRREAEEGIEALPVIHRVDKAAVKKHFEQIRQEALGLVRDEVEKVTKGKGMEGRLIK